MDFLKREIVSINAAAFLIGAAGFLSRVLGLFRDRLLAGHFGASRELDIYYAAFQIPDFIYTLFLIGAAGGAIIPIFLEYAKKDKAESERLIDSLMSIFLIIALVFSLLVFFAAPLVIDFLVPGFGPEEKRLTVTLARIMMASPIFLSLSNIISSVAQAYRRFAAFALSPVFYNVGIILGIVFFLPRFGLSGLAYGVILGAFLHFAVQLPAFFSLGFRLKPVFSFYTAFFKKGAFHPAHSDDGMSGVHPGIKKIIFISAPRVLSISLGAITLIVINAIASEFSRGSIAVLRFAENIEFIPVGIVGVSFAVAVFPKLAESFIKKDAAEFFVSFFGTFKATLFWLAPLSVFFYVLRSHIVRLSLGTGLFDWRDTRLTAAVLGIFSLSIITQSLIYLFIRAFYAMNKTARPLLINGAVMVLTVFLSFFLAGMFSNPASAVPILASKILKVRDLGDISVLGLALAWTLGQFLNFIFLWKLFLSEAKKSFGGVIEKGVSIHIATILGTALFSGFAVYGVRLLLGFMILDTFFGVLIQGFLSCLAGAMVYAALLYKLDNDEIKSIIEVFKRRLLKTSVLPQQLDGVDR